ncbi:uracil-DNA glycosylase [Sneathiella marina]|uniref:Uracil-DNA glycosylase n=1 Tax=Sneathiella marina TaxID=2950108 RepID=A0ABY4W765_9PROT|nr:uracil-DNA glycosylase [Sneathiella marina]USG63012.1 uracil-DNA glycosylase [Sneathiella marina]
MTEADVNKTTSPDPKLDESWLEHLRPEFNKPYMKDLKQFLISEKRLNKTIYPPGSQIFSAFNGTQFAKVRLVILGQDPYHGPGQAHGLSFSVRPGVRVPPSLVNIYKEIERDLNIPRPNNGFLECWAKQGVLLLNSVLTVERGNAGAHQKKGWENFTDAAIASIAEKRENIVFLLWGSYAQKKGRFIDRNKHYVLESVHPSPLSAHRGFIGNGHFSKANEFLKSINETPIDWSVGDL